MTQFRIISADSHVIEPGDAWTGHIDPQYRERAPRLVHGDEEDFFLIEGQRQGWLGLMAGAGKGPKVTQAKGRFDVTVPKAAWDPHARLETILADGVEGEVLYPTIGLSIHRLADLPFRNACLDAYNRWLAGFCEAVPGRFKGIGMVSLDNLEGAVEQLHRVKALGMAGAMVPLRPYSDVSYTTKHYDPFWAAAESLELPVTMHIFTEPNALSPGAENNFVDWVTKTGSIQRTLAELIISGVFDRFPKLKVVSAENDIGWIGNFLERMDHRFETKRYVQYAGIELAMEPSDYFRRNVVATFMRDEPGIALREIIGVDNILWSSDYPHHESTWPNSRAILAKHFAGVPEADQRKIAAENTAKLYGFA